MPQVKKAVVKKHPGGRPRIVFTEEHTQQVTMLSEFMCTNEEIAAVLGISADTLTRRFAEAIKKGHLKAAQSLRRLQFRSALGYWDERKVDDGHGGEKTERRYIPPSPVMQIWLGKQYLKQVDRVETDVNQNITSFKIEVLDEETRTFIEKGEFFKAQLPGNNGLPPAKDDQDKK